MTIVVVITYSRYVGIVDLNLITIVRNAVIMSLKSQSTAVLKSNRDAIQGA